MWFHLNFIYIDICFCFLVCLFKSLFSYWLNFSFLNWHCVLFLDWFIVRLSQFQIQSWSSLNPVFKFLFLVWNLSLKKFCGFEPLFGKSLLLKIFYLKKFLIRLVLFFDYIANIQWLLVFSWFFSQISIGIIIWLQNWLFFFICFYQTLWTSN